MPLFNFFKKNEKSCKKAIDNSGTKWYNIVTTKGKPDKRKEKQNDKTAG